MSPGTDKKFSGYQAMMWALRQPGLHPTEKLILVVIASHSPNPFPSAKTIASMVGVSDRAIRTWYPKLEEKGVLKRLINGAPGNGPKETRTNYFQLSIPQGFSAHSPRGAHLQGGLTSASGIEVTLASVGGVGSTSAKQTMLNNQENIQEKEDVASQRLAAFSNPNEAGRRLTIDLNTEEVLPLEEATVRLEAMKAHMDSIRTKSPSSLPRCSNP